MKYLIFIVTTLFLTSCDIDQSETSSFLSDDTIVFGHEVGECQGRDICYELFKIENGKLYEDVNEFPTDSNWTEMSVENYELVKDLISFFPEELLLENNEIVGLDSGMDTVHYKIGIVKDGELKEWEIKDIRPDYLNDFINQVSLKIDLLQ